MTKNFEASLANIARGYASTATRLAKGFAPNTHLRESIVSTVEQKGRATFIIRTRAKGPDARAREYGSGIHARRGNRGYIRIRPRNKKVLVFPWDKAADYIPKTSDGRVILKEVNHPGVEAANNGKGYIHPAINETRRLYRKRLAQELIQGIKLDLRAGFLVK